MEQMYGQYFNQSQEDHISEMIDMKSPPMNPEMASLPSTDENFSMQEDEDFWGKRIQAEMNNQSFDAINQNQSSNSSPWLSENRDNEFIDEIFPSCKSCQLQENQISIEESYGFETSKSLQISTEPKKFVDQERIDKVKRYWLKKPQRVFQKIIRYESRKKVANDRIRDAGRFIKLATGLKSVPNPIENPENKLQQTTKKNETVPNCKDLSTKKRRS